MRKENPSIKTTLSMEDRILMPQELTEGYFTKDSEGHVNYTPYYADMMLINVFFLHCVDGIAFEVKETENGGNEIAENIYEAVTASSKAADPDMLNLRETLEYVKAAYSPVKAG